MIDYVQKNVLTTNCATERHEMDPIFTIETRHRATVEEEEEEESSSSVARPSSVKKVAIFFIPFLIDYLQIYVIDVHS